MFPFLFQIGKYPFPPTYGVIVALTVVACYFMVRVYARWEGIDPKKAADGILTAALVGFLGAKLLEVAVSWRKVVDDPKQFLIIMGLSGGVFLGGLLSALFFGLWWMKRMNVSGLLTLDLVGMTGCLSMALARWACFASGCCHGKPTTLPWGVTFPEIAHKLHAALPYGPVHPTQLYESFGSAIVFAFLYRFYQRHKRFHGQVGALFLIIYGVMRYLIEFFRGDSARGFLFGGLLSTSQFICVFLILGGLAGYLYLARRHRLSGAPDWKAAR